MFWEEEGIVIVLSCLPFSPCKKRVEEYVDDSELDNEQSPPENEIEESVSMERSRPRDVE